MENGKVYFGNFKEESKRHGGWFIGHFLDETSCKRNDIEIKYWEFPHGIANHEKKFQKSASEITLILRGKIEGIIDGERVKLQAGEYVFIPPGVKNGFPDIVLEYVEGITIKFPSIPNDKVRIEE